MASNLGHKCLHMSHGKNVRLILVKIKILSFKLHYSGDYFLERFFFFLYRSLISPTGKGLASWLLFVVSHCKFVTFPLVSWVRCGT